MTYLFPEYPDIPISQEVIDIVDNKTLSFVPYEKKLELCIQHELPMPDLIWRGVVNEDSIGYMRHELEEKIGYCEGYIAKTWSVLYKEQFMGKIKCDTIKHLAYMNSSGLIPAHVIDKSIRKAMENLAIIDSVSELHSFVLEDLYDEMPKDKVDASLVRIERTINRVFPIDTIAIWSKLEKLEDSMNITIDNKASVMKALANSNVFKSKPSKAYQAFVMYLKKKGRL